MHCVRRHTRKLSLRIHCGHHQCPGRRPGYHQAKVRHARDASQLANVIHRFEVPGPGMTHAQLILVQVHLAKWRWGGWECG